MKDMLDTFSTKFVSAVHYRATELFAGLAMTIAGFFGTFLISTSDRPQVLHIQLEPWLGTVLLLAGISLVSFAWYMAPSTSDGRPRAYIVFKILFREMSETGMAFAFFAFILVFAAKVAGFDFAMDALITLFIVLTILSVCASIAVSLMTHQERSKGRY